METSARGIDHRIAELLLKEDISEFMHHEADLLDERRFEEWLDLLDDDIEYTMPLRLNLRHDEIDDEATRAGEDVCWFDEGKSTLTKRVEQIRTGEHWAEEPFSRVSHIVSNIRIHSVKPEAGDGNVTRGSRPAEVEVGCRFIVYRNRVAAETDLWVGRRTDTLRATPDGWLLRRRHLLLDQNVLLAKNLTVLF